MGFSIRFIALSMLMVLTIGQKQNYVNHAPDFVTFLDPVSLNSGLATITPSSQGYLVSLRGDGWTYGNPITLIAGESTTNWATLLQSNGVTGVGPIAATCNPNYNSANRADDNFNGLGASTTCPADFATVYTGTTTITGTTSSLTAPTALELIVNAPVSWTFTQPAAPFAGQVIGVEVQDYNVASPAVIVVSAAGTASATTPAGATSNAQQYALATFSYAFYVQTTGTAVVCFQSDDQYTTSPGNCGEQLFVYGHSDQSAGVLSASVTILFALIALIFLN